MNSTFAKAVGEYLEGNRAGTKALHDVPGLLGAPDYLYSLACARDPLLSSEYLRGLFRAVQKRIEQEVRRG